MGNIVRMKSGSDIPARYDAEYRVFPGVQGQPPEVRNLRADIDTSAEDDEIELSVVFDETEAGSGMYLQTLMLHLDVKAARALAYELLLLANDVE